MNGHHEKMERDALGQDLAAICAKEAEAASLVGHVREIVGPVRVARVPVVKKSV